MKTSVITVLASVGLAVAGTPDYCLPPGTDAKNGYIYRDVSEKCKLIGIADECCVTFVDGGYTQTSCNDDEKTKNWQYDLDTALAKQVAKDGQFDGTMEGGWTVAFQLLTTALHHRETFIPWNEGLWDFPGDWVPSAVYFNAGGDGFFDRIVASWGC